MTPESEKRIREKAAKYAYQTTNNIANKGIQNITYKLVFESILLGARLLEQELNRNNKS